MPDGTAAIDLSTLDLAKLNFELDLDDTTYSVALGRVSARLIGELELFFSVSIDDLIVRLVAQKVTPFEAAALVFLARRMAKEDPSADELLDSITVGSSIAVRFVGDVVPSVALDADPNS